MSWSPSWKSSKRPRKQRNYRHNAPAHIQQHHLSMHLSKALRKEHKQRSVEARVGDTVKVLRGQFKGKSGAVDRIDRKEHKVYVNGVELTKKDGTKVTTPLHPSNLQLQTLDTKDKRRFKSSTTTTENKPKASKKEGKSANS